MLYWFLPLLARAVTNTTSTTNTGGGFNIGIFFGCYYGIGVFLLIIVILLSHCCYLNRTFRAGYRSECYYKMWCCHEDWDLIDSWYYHYEKDKNTVNRCFWKCVGCYYKEDPLDEGNSKDDLEDLKDHFPCISGIFTVIFLPIVMLIVIIAHMCPRKGEKEIEEYLHSEDKQRFLANHPDWPDKATYNRYFKPGQTRTTIQSTDVVQAPPSGAEYAQPQEQYAQPVSAQSIL